MIETRSEKSSQNCYAPPLCAQEFANDWACTIGLKRLLSPISLNLDVMATVVDLHRRSFAIDLRRRSVFPIIFGASFHAKNANLMLIDGSAQQRLRMGKWGDRSHHDRPSKHDNPDTCRLHQQTQPTIPMAIFLRTVFNTLALNRGCLAHIKTQAAPSITITSITI